MGSISCTRLVFDRQPVVKVKKLTEDLTEGVVTIVPGTENLTLAHETMYMPEIIANYEMTLEPHERWLLTVEVVPQPANGPKIVGTVPREVTPASIWTDNRIFNKLLLRCRQDLEGLQTSFPEGSLPAAGIPWYVAPFGRDSLITGLQTLPLSPHRAIGTLRVLASLQGTKVDTRREEQPGKILHEMRYGEMARLGEVPHSPYYGSIDATPLWIWLFAETVAWTGNEDLFRELLPNARLAVEWISKYGDLDGDGLVEYIGVAQDVGHINNQVWKDSYDSLNHSMVLPHKARLPRSKCRATSTPGCASSRRFARYLARKHGDASSRRRQRLFAIWSRDCSGCRPMSFMRRHSTERKNRSLC